MSFKTALSFLSIFKLGKRSRQDPQESVSAAGYYPLIGLLIGLALYFSNLIIGLWQTDLLTAALVLAIWVIITGAMHLDGLSDTIDGIYSAHKNPAKAHTAIHDPYCGTMAMLLASTFLIVKFAALLTLIGQNNAALLIWVPCIARGLLLFWMAKSTPSENSYMLQGWYPKITSLRFRLIAGVFILAAAWYSSWWLIAACVVILWLLARLRRWYHATLGGITGDACGCFIELAELFLLIAMIQLSNKHASTLEFYFKVISEQMPSWTI